MTRFPEIDFAVPGRPVGGTSNGVVHEDEWGRYVLVKGVRAAKPSPDAPFHEALSAFGELERELGEAGMDFSDVVRTWLYADRILDWYADLNRARDTFFRAKGVHGRYVPASTGIGWSGGAGDRIVLGAFAAKAKEPGIIRVEALPSPLQCPALEYGSSFSRAAELRTPGWRRVIVSGTASIEPQSHEVAHVGDIVGQIDCTMRAVEAIYASRGMSWRDVTGALVYVKDAAYLENWEAWLEAHPEYPRGHSRAIMADVCRPEWLFEIESDATTWK